MLFSFSLANNAKANRNFCLLTCMQYLLVLDDTLKLLLPSFFTLKWTLNNKSLCIFKTMTTLQDKVRYYIPLKEPRHSNQRLWRLSLRWKLVWRHFMGLSALCTQGPNLGGLPPWVDLNSRLRSFLTRMLQLPRLPLAPLSVCLCVCARSWKPSTAARSVYLGGRLGHILSRQFPMWATTSLTSSVDSSFREKEPRSYSMDSCKRDDS